MNGLVLVAAGSSRRFGGRVSKVLRRVGGTPVIVRALTPFRVGAEPLVTTVVAREDDIAAMKRVLPSTVRVVAGGATRSESVRRGIEALPPMVDVILVHDAARPLVSVKIVRQVLAGAIRDGAAAAMIRVADSLHRLEPADPPRIAEAVDRTRLYAAQTPQAARADLFRQALAVAVRDGTDDTDEVGMLLRAGIPVTPVHGHRHNLKITTPEDLELAEHLLAVERGRKS